MEKGVDGKEKDIARSDWCASNLYCKKTKESNWNKMDSRICALSSAAVTVRYLIVVSVSI